MYAKKSAIIALLFILTFPACLFAQNSTPEEMFKKSFPKYQYESISPTEIKGVYEVYAGNQIYYYMPEAEVVLAGSIITKDGIDLTRESVLGKIKKKMAVLPLDQAFKIGNGKTTIVEFMDPNCYHCRLAFNFFSQRKDVTIYVFFFPMSEDSEKKVRHILCSKDKLKTYENVMAGKLDKDDALNICADKKVDETVKTHSQLASKTGIYATPLFYIKGQVVNGFDQLTIEKLLKD